MKSTVLTAVLAVMLPMAALFTGCEEHEMLEISVAELRENTSGGYYDAVVTVDHADDSLKSSPRADFYVRTVPGDSYYDLDALTFTSGSNEPGLEAGDTFIVPLHDPDWRFYVRGGQDIIASADVLDMLPEARRYHPLKSEAAALARTVVWQQENGGLQPVVPALPPEWELTGENLEPPPGEFGYVAYSKIRVGEAKETLSVFFRKLSADELQEIAETSDTEFMRRLLRSSWVVATYGREDVVEGHDSLIVDARGSGEHDWLYSYNYIEDGYLKRIDIDADAREWVMTAAEKEQEKATRAVFINYDYGLEPDAAWAAEVTIRRNGEGLLRKTSATGVIIEKGFTLNREEMRSISNMLREMDLQPVSSPAGCPDNAGAIMTVYDELAEYVLCFGPEQPGSFSELEELLRQTVLTKVGEP